MSHVLIVDDDANTREALVALVQAEGFTAAAAGSVAEARIQLVRQRPDVVLMDLRLPDGSGMDLFDDLEDRASIEIILITGHASVESAVEALRLGASDYLTKPVNLQRLKAVLARVPQSGELRAEIGAAARRAAQPRPLRPPRRPLRADAGGLRQDRARRAHRGHRAAARARAAPARKSSRAPSTTSRAAASSRSSRSTAAPSRPT